VVDDPWWVVATVGLKLSTILFLSDFFLPNFLLNVQSRGHRSSGNFLINLLAGIAAYSHRPKKPTINLAEQDRMLLMAA